MTPAARLLRPACLALAVAAALACAPEEQGVDAAAPGRAAPDAAANGAAATTPDPALAALDDEQRAALEAERAGRPADRHYGALAPLDSAEPRPGERAATFAGGCFWCVEVPFESLPGVRAAISGYAGGAETNPTYLEVGRGATGHTEAVRVLYDPREIDYAQLLEVFWRAHDPTDAGGQFVDRGAEYRPEIFVHDAEQRAVAEASKRALQESGRFDAPIVTPITDLGAFWPAEQGHQDFFRKKPKDYKRYRSGSGRDAFLDRVWGADREVRIEKPDPSSVSAETPRWSRPSDAELKARLTPLQWKVTQEDGTETAFENAYWDNKAEGLYVDIVSGEPLFSSKHKYASGTGWPSFWKVLAPENVTTREDRSFFTTLTEVRSKHADSHLGHVFRDGPAPTGLRYCMNSAALRFVPVDELEEQGYGDWVAHFEE